MIRNLVDVCVLMLVVSTREVMTEDRYFRAASNADRHVGPATAAP